MQEQSIEGKNQKSTDKHSSFDGLIQEDIDLSDIYYAVIKFIFIQLFSSQNLHPTVNKPQLMPAQCQCKLEM